MRSVLEAQGIACTVRNDFLSSGVGELPVNECWPEIWVLDDDTADMARRIIASHESPGDAPAPWRCEQCGEVSEGQFGQCWQCGAVRV